WDLHPDDPTAAPGLDLVSQAVASLRDRLDSFLNARDDRAQLDASLGLDADDPPALRLLERYASDARRQFSRCLNELRRLQSLVPVAPASSSAPSSRPPGPRPDRSRREHPSSSAASPPPAPSEPPAPAPTSPPSPARNEPIPRPSPPARPSLRTVLPGPSAPLNRRARRAQAAAARRS
ncbi:hypothetical protein AB1L88_26815, partial [Tautonia sp. JC769]